jgi:peroxiredoxin
VVLVAVLVVTTGLRDGAGSAAGTSPGAVGTTFPAFAFNDIDGRPTDRSTLAGRRAIVWFTDSACQPCQLGAARVRQLEEQPDSPALAVLAVFVNPQDSNTTLSSWRTTYGRPDWKVALDADGALANQVGLQTLDTKFLLGPDSKILNVDSNPVDDANIHMLQQKVVP